MISQLFLWINLIAAIFFIWWFWSSRGAAKKPPALDLKKGPPLLPTSSPVAEKPKSPAAMAPTDPTITEKIKGAKNLNILFIYNGHDWDAHEVLGLPAGCSIAMATQKYQELIKTAHAGQLEFYEAAYEAILKKS